MSEPRYAGPLGSVRLVVPAGPNAPLLRPGAPALEVMTDLTIEAPHVVAPERQIDDALHDMVAFGVRLLLVVREHEVLGVVTSYDIMGERPIQFLQDPFKSGKPHRHADVKVADVMTPLAEAPPLRLRWVERATVADIATLFRANADSHLLVADEAARGAGIEIRGIFSRTRLERQFGPL